MAFLQVITFLNSARMAKDQTCHTSAWIFIVTESLHIAMLYLIAIFMFVNLGSLPNKAIRMWGNSNMCVLLNS